MTAQIFNSVRDLDMGMERKAGSSAIFIVLFPNDLLKIKSVNMCRSLSFTADKSIFNITHLFIHFICPVRAPFSVMLAPSLCINGNEAYYQVRGVLINNFSPKSVQSVALWLYFRVEGEVHYMTLLVFVKFCYSFLKFDV